MASAEVEMADSSRHASSESSGVSSGSANGSATAKGVKSYYQSKVRVTLWGIELDYLPRARAMGPSDI